MLGMAKDTGGALNELAHIRQSVEDILTTPIGTRLMRRDYGSRLFDLVDRPLDDAGLLEFYAATVEALAKWEPRIRVLSVSHLVAQGKVSITVHAEILKNQKPLTMEGIYLG